MQANEWLMERRKQPQATETKLTRLQQAVITEMDQFLNSPDSSPAFRQAGMVFRPIIIANLKATPDEEIREFICGIKDALDVILRAGR